jgi:hypothetical protein
MEERQIIHKKIFTKKKFQDSYPDVSLPIMGMAEGTGR